MLEVFAYIIILALVGLVVAYLYVDAQRKKAIKQQKQAAILLATRIKANFKSDVYQFVEQENLTSKQYESIYRIANNFFIFQPVTRQSIEFYKYSLNNVITAIPNGGPESIHFNLMQEQITLFIDSLPIAANYYTLAFYRKTLPQLINNLVNAKEEICKVESELSNEGSFTSEVA
jgi:hypothetical protein